MIRRSTVRRSVAIPAPLLNDDRLTWKAKGLAAFLLSKPDAWRIDARALARCGPDGRDAVLSGLTELREAGYLVTRRGQGDDGRWWTESVLYESPADADADAAGDLEHAATEVGFSGSGSPDPGKPGHLPSLEREKTPNPTGSAGRGPGSRATGTNPRALGTNPRATGRAGRPVDPRVAAEEATVAAARRRAEVDAARARGDVCPACLGEGWRTVELIGDDAALDRCDTCDGDGVRLTA